MKKEPIEPIHVMRERYRPKLIEVLFLAESPPLSDNGRFFYKPQREPKMDGLFNELLKVAFPGLDPTKGEKADHLRRFQEAGYFLMDATDTPLNKGVSKIDRNAILRASVASKVEEIKGLVTPQTAIFVIKAPLFEMFAQPLRDAGLNVAHSVAIPFPLTGWQKEFSKVVSPILRRIGK